MVVTVFCCSSCIYVSGCNDGIGGWNSSSQSRFERTIAQQIALDGVHALDVLSQSGSIPITGADVTDCNLVARVVAQAPTEEEARDLAERVEIVAQAAGTTLKIRSKEPNVSNNRWIGVSYTMTIPRRMNVRCNSRFGALDVSHIEGSLRATEVTASNLSAVSGNGGVRVACSAAGPADLKAQVRSSFGGVDFTAPAGFGGEVSLNANFGTVKTALPITVSGEISRNRVAGTIGDGVGKIRLESGNGSVGLR
jgi:hypothetical protein